MRVFKIQLLPYTHFVSKYKLLPLLLSKSRQFCNFHHAVDNIRRDEFSNRSEFIELLLQGNKVKVHETWLRHHCKCGDCFSLENNERKVVPTSNWLSAKIQSVVRNGPEMSLELQWSDGHISKFQQDTLLSCIPCEIDTGKSDNIPLSPSPIIDYQQFITTNDPLRNSVTYQDFMKNDTVLRKLLVDIVNTGFGVVVGVNGLEETRLAHNRISHPVRTFYGDGVTVLVPDAAYQDTAYSFASLPLHTDTSYFIEPMGLQSFAILERRGGTGGLNCFSDGFLTSKNLFDESPELYDILTKTQLPFQYLEEGRFDYQSIAPTLLIHPVTGQIQQIRYNPRHITNVSWIPRNRIQLFYEAFIRFTQLLEENKFWIQLEPGTLLWMDNWRILHGRSAFTGHRSVASAYFPTSDWRSKARSVGIQCS